MKKLVFATNNNHKFTEIEHLLKNKFHLLNLKDINCYDDIPELKDTLEENAFEKANYIYLKYNIDCFADDTGLEIEALNGEPGVFSARYAGIHGDSEANMKKVIEKLKNCKNRKAQFRTVISLIENGKESKFEGIVKGTILDEKRGSDGFGYDPIFLPENYSRTFAELNLDEKNKISHRALAFNKLIQYLEDRV